MNFKRLLAAMAVASSGVAVWAGDTPVGTALTYQGHLKQSGLPVNGVVGMEFRLFDAPSGGTPLETQSASLPVADGVFTASFGFGASAFDGHERWLEIVVGTTTLSPRQRLAPAPYAMYALNGPGNWTNPAGGVVTTSNSVGIGTAAPTQALHVGGNVRVDGWIGSDQAQAVNIFANNRRVYRYVDATFNSENSPNLIGGAAGNSVAADVIGATIGGGGSDLFNQFNSVTKKFGTIAGGLANECAGEQGAIGGGAGNAISQLYGAIGGGQSNSVDHWFGTIAGGAANTVSGPWGVIAGGIGNQVAGERAAIGGGSFNNVGGDFAFAGGGDLNNVSADFGAIGGGQFNIVSGSHGTVAGGKFNEANGDFSFAAGLQAKANHPGTFVWAHNTGTDFASTGAGQFLIRAGGGVGINTNAPGKALTVAGDMEVGTNAGDYRHLRLGGGNSSGFLYGSWPVLGDGIHMGYNYYASPGGHVIVNAGGETSRVSMGYGSISLATGGANQVPVTRLFVNSIGRVGIGTSSPAQALHVAGSVQATCGILTCSDARFKEHIEPLAGALETVSSLRGVTFDWRRGEYPDRQFADGRQIGFIAQEVESVLPSVVSTGGDGFKSIDYGRLTPLLVEALRDLRAEKDTQIAAQQEVIEQLLQRVETLERQSTPNR